MKSTKIKLNSRHLKVGDKIIRTSGAYSTTPLEVVNKNKSHIKLKYRNGTEVILPIETFESDETSQWVRYTLD